MSEQGDYCCERMETFTVSGSGFGLGLLIIVFVVIGAGIAAYLFVPRASKPRLRDVRTMSLVFVILLAFGVSIFFANPTPITITIQQGKVTLSAGAADGGTNSFLSTEVVQAYADTLGNGVLASISKQYGTNLGNYNVGVFTLSNGATAYVASDNVNNIVVELKDGTYFVFGPPQSNFTSFVSYFSQEIVPVSNST